MSEDYLQGWYDSIRDARPWAEEVFRTDLVADNSLRSAALVVLGVQGLVRELEQRVLTAEREAANLKEQLNMYPRMKTVRLPPDL